MEIPLTPMEFARRARRLYADREAVVDGDLRLSYAQFLARCDRWSAALQALGVGPGDRVDVDGCGKRRDEDRAAGPHEQPFGEDRRAGRRAAR